VLAAGDLDTAALDHLDEALTLAMTARRRPRVEVDLDAVTFVDSAAIDAMLCAARQARAAGGEFWVANPPLQLRRLLAIPEIGRLLHVRSRHPG
jgi:anti-anti-sigma factor